MSSVTISSRFHGPPASGNGGYSCGLAAAQLGHRGPVRVRLRVPPPLDRPLEVRRDGESAQLLDGERVVAEAVPTALELQVPDPVEYQAAVDAYTSFDVDGYAAVHAFPTCFTCGPGRGSGDGLRLFPARLPGRADLVVSPWRPDPSFVDSDDRIPDEILWAALDCPTWFAWAVADSSPGPAVLGELTAGIERRAIPDEQLVVAAWRIDADGRKRSSGAAVWDADGSLVAKALATWVVLDESHYESFGVKKG